MKKYKIIMHIMPWEVDYLHLSFMQLRKAYYYLDSPNIEISTILNLSSYITNWEESILPKEFFVQKYEDLQKIIAPINNKSRIYDGDKLYGHLDFQREEVDEETDFYIQICPDICFSESALSYLIESSRQIKNKYFIITPQTSKVGDADWDEITSPNFIQIPYKDYLKVDVFDVNYTNDSMTERSLQPLSKSKFAGWFDLYSKELYENILTIPEEWNGYGPWDWYSMQLLEYCKKEGLDYQQYLLKGETIWMYPSGPLVDDAFAKYYKDFLTLNKIENQREVFESNMNKYLVSNIQRLEENQII